MGERLKMKARNFNVKKEKIDECPVNNTEYDGLDIKVYTDVTSWQECNERCQYCAGCYAWVWLSKTSTDEERHEHCHLKNKDFRHEEKKGVISGRKDCAKKGLGKRIHKCGHTNCGSASWSLRIARQYCNGKDRCYLRASNRMFSDPCWGIHKYLDVTFQCIKSKTPVRTPRYVALGCFNDRRNRAIKGRFVRFNPSIIMQKCSERARLIGDGVFAVQYNNECFTSRSASRTYNTYGRTTGCRNGRGGAWKMNVYKLVGGSTADTTVAPITTVATTTSTDDEERNSYITANVPAPTTSHRCISRRWGLCLRWQTSTNYHQRAKASLTFVLPDVD